MNIAIDILHISYWNFYKNIIKKLELDNNKVFIFVRKRGSLLQVIENESQIHSKIIITGKYFKGRKKLILHLLRIPKLIYLLYKYKIDVVSSDGFFIGLAAKFKDIPAIMHSDDFEYTFSYKMTQIFSTKMIIPDVFPKTSIKDIHYNGCKEYAYLSEKYFTPKKEDILGMGSFNKGYVFIRLISKSSLNYLNNEDIYRDIDLIIKHLKNMGIAVLMSSEENYQKRYDNCIILNPPIKNFHSVLKYARLVITEGDTMARESIILGTKVIYMGGRIMKIHDYFKMDNDFDEINNVEEIIKNIDEKVECNNRHHQMEFDDINEIMYNYIIDSVK